MTTIFDTNHPRHAEWTAAWDRLVPMSGKCDTLEGELMRAAGRIHYDYWNNGFGNNWTGALAYLDEHLGLRRSILETLEPYAGGKIAHGRRFDYSERDVIAVAITRLCLSVLNVVATSPCDTPNPCDMFDLTGPDYRPDEEVDEWVDEIGMYADLGDTFGHEIGSFSADQCERIDELLAARGLAIAEIRTGFEIVEHVH